jgi:hypothetical protein
MIERMMVLMMMMMKRQQTWKSLKRVDYLMNMTMYATYSQFA